MMDDRTHDREILAHYRKLWGNSRRKVPVPHTYEDAPSPLFVYEFPGDQRDPTWLYASLGASRQILRDREGAGEIQMEVFMMANQARDELIDSLGTIALYPHLHQTYFAEGHTVHGAGSRGIVAGSPLTDLVIARAEYGEKPDFVHHSDNSHTHLLWVIPIY